MSKPFPEEIEPLRLAQAGRELIGQIPLANMVRLASLLDDRLPLNREAGHGIGGDDVGQVVSVALKFDLDEAGQAYVVGNINAEVSLQCQRCMQPMRCTISEKISLGIVLSEEQAEQLPGYYEPLLLQDSAVPVSELIEDELILGLPAVALHDKGQCSASGRLSVTAGGDAFSEDVDAALPARPNPFAVLSQIKPQLKHKPEKKKAPKQ